MTILHAFVSFVLVTSVSAVYEIQGHVVCGTGAEGNKIAEDNANGQVWVELYYMEGDRDVTYCTPFRVGGHKYDDSKSTKYGEAKGLECINRCIAQKKYEREINQVTFYDDKTGCFCVEGGEGGATERSMSTCDLSQTNEKMHVRRTMHDSRVSRNARQKHSVSNDDNFVHLEGAAGRTDMLLDGWLLVRVTNYNCQGRTQVPPYGSWTKVGDLVDQTLIVDMDKPRLVGEIKITLSEREAEDTKWKVSIRATEMAGKLLECAEFTFSRIIIEKTLKCKKAIVGRFLYTNRTAGSRSGVTVTVTVVNDPVTRLNNIAFKRPTEMSWEEGKVKTHAEDKAVDGGYDTSTIIHTQSVDSLETQLKRPAFWQVDFEELITIDRIDLYISRRFYKTNSQYSKMVILTNRGNLAEWTLCNRVGEDLRELITDSARSDNAYKRVNCNEEATKARVVRIQNPNGKTMMFYEVEIFEANVMWFMVPYDCFDELTPKFGCKDLTLDLTNGQHTKKPWKRQEETHEVAETEKALEENEGYYTIKNRMFNGMLYAGYDSPENKKMVAGLRQVHARVLSEGNYNNDREYRRLNEISNGKIMFWTLKKEVKGNTSDKNKGNKDYYRIINKYTGKPMYLGGSTGTGDSDYYVKVGHKDFGTRANYKPQGDKELWDLEKQDDSYYKIVSIAMRKNNTERWMFAATANNHFVRISEDPYDSKHDGANIWEIAKA